MLKIPPGFLVTCAGCDQPATAVFVTKLGRTILVCSDCGTRLLSGTQYTLRNTKPPTATEAESVVDC